MACSPGTGYEKSGLGNFYSYPQWLCPHVNSACVYVLPWAGSDFSPPFPSIYIDTRINFLDNGFGNMILGDS